MMWRISPSGRMARNSMAVARPVATQYLERSRTRAWSCGCTASIQPNPAILSMGMARISHSVWLVYSALPRASVRKMPTGTTSVRLVNRASCSCWLSWRVAVGCGIGTGAVRVGRTPSWRRFSVNSQSCRCTPCRCWYADCSARLRSLSSTLSARRRSSWRRNSSTVSGAKSMLQAKTCAWPPESTNAGVAGLSARAFGSGRSGSGRAVMSDDG